MNKGCKTRIETRYGIVVEEFVFHCHVEKVLNASATVLRTVCKRKASKHVTKSLNFCGKHNVWHAWWYPVPSVADYVVDNFVAAESDFLPILWAHAPVSYYQWSWVHISWTSQRWGQRAAPEHLHCRYFAASTSCNIRYCQLSLVFAINLHRLPSVCCDFICYCLLILASTVFALSCQFICDFVMFLFVFYV